MTQRRHRLSRRLAALLSVTAAVLLVVASPAAGASQAVSITGSDASEFPVVRFAFAIDSEQGTLPEIRLTENGRELSGVKVYNGRMGLYENEASSEIILALDTSLSMKSPKLDDAVAAASAMLDQARPGDRVGLVTFGGEAKVLVEPTEELSEIRNALQKVELRQNTAMFDSIVEASSLFGGDAANRAIVVISDGKDLGSSATLDEAVDAARKAAAPVWSVAIQPKGVEPDELVDLGTRSEGGFRSVADSAELEALFGELGRQLLRGYWLEYESRATTAGAVRVEIEAEGIGSAETTFAATPVLDEAGKAVAYERPEPSSAQAPAVPLPRGQLGMLLASLPFALILFFLGFQWLQRRSRPDLAKRLQPYVASTQRSLEQLQAGNAGEQSGARAWLQPFLLLWDRLLGRSGYFARIRRLAEQANIAIKPSELFTAQVAAAMFGALLGAAMGGALAVLPVMLVVGYVPMFWLRTKARRRRKAFEDQLADVLQGVSSSLKAGHSFNQAINGVIKDTPNPTAEEFSRVMTEARLGLPLEAALQAMADRMGSPDFDFAVTTVNIQRTVGGSLADILEMVGDTVRNRQQFRKKVKALVSMGQMSAYVLLGMPVFMLGVITMMSPDYTAPLFHTQAGNIMLAAGTFSMILGYVSCMKIVRVKI